MSDEEIVVDETKTLGVKKSKVSLASYKSKGAADNKRELDKHNKLIEKRTENRVLKAKSEAKKKPIDKRRELLESRFRAVRSRVRARNYSDANIKAWIRELEIINNNPKLWIKETSNGTLPYPRQGKGKRSAMSILDSMDLD